VCRFCPAKHAPCFASSSADAADWDSRDEDPQNQQLWEQDWDDDNIDDDFSQRLKAELERQMQQKKQEQQQQQPAPETK
jgi:26 proteasome complex subunit DSS1